MGGQLDGRLGLQGGAQSTTGFMANIMSSMNRLITGIQHDIQNLPAKLDELNVGEHVRNQISKVTTPLTRFAEIMTGVLNRPATQSVSQVIQLKIGELMSIVPTVFENLRFAANSGIKLMNILPETMRAACKFLLFNL